MDLPTIWFLLVGVLIIGYAVLDGFDLGVGVLYLFARREEERRIYLNAIGPVWDGNEVWLLTGGGALFAAFPVVYATVFSAFYLAMMLMVVALIARAVSFEFRGKLEGAGWKKLWDWFLIGFLPLVIFASVAWAVMEHERKEDRMDRLESRIEAIQRMQAIQVRECKAAAKAASGPLGLTAVLPTFGSHKNSIAGMLYLLVNLLCPRIRRPAPMGSRLKSPMGAILPVSSSRLKSMLHALYCVA